MPKFTISKKVWSGFIVLTMLVILLFILAVLQVNSFVLAAIAFIFALVCVFFSFLFSKRLDASLTQMQSVLTQFAQGQYHISITPQNMVDFEEMKPVLQKVIDGMQEQQKVLSSAAVGDFSHSVATRSNNDEINQAIRKMIASNGEMISLLRSTAAQLTQGSDQIASMAQHLADGSSDQAATIEEITAVVSEISAMAEQNSQTANETLQEVQQTSLLMNDCTGAMAEMLQAMAEMDQNAHGISKVMKVIEDIAFQTNILALNASVEAARAGQHGKGFAVVADEVRTLAAKSAAASKETAALIERSIRGVENSSRIVTKVNSSILEAGAIADKNASSIERIQGASQRQSQAMNEVASSISQLSSVVQQGAHNAQESAFTSADISAQANVLDQIVARFHLVGDGAKSSSKAYELTPDLLTGHPMIDSQHKELIDAINRLLDACASGQGSDVINQTVQFLYDYTTKHFSEEEVLQQQYGYPDRANHHKMHEKFKADVTELGRRLTEEGPTMELIGKVNSTIAGWLLKHIKSQDTKVAAHIRAQSGLQA